MYVYYVLRLSEIYSFQFVHNNLNINQYSSFQSTIMHPWVMYYLIETAGGTRYYIYAIFVMCLKIYIPSLFWYIFFRYCPYMKGANPV